MFSITLLDELKKIQGVQYSTVYLDTNCCSIALKIINFQLSLVK